MIDVDSKDFDYREYVGKGHRRKYDLFSAHQFILLFQLGLREYHRVLDIGCGSLRAGKLLIPYLMEGNYYGIEPNESVLNTGIEKEIGWDLVRIKKPHFSHDSNFELGEFGCDFDFVLAHSIFTHCSKRQIEKCLMSLGEVMRGDSLFFGTFMEGKSDYSGSEWEYPECVTYTEGFIIDAAKTFGFIYERLEYVHVNGHQTWFKLIREAA